MIPSFENPETMNFLLKVKRDSVIRRNECPNNEVFEELKGYDQSVFFFTGRHPFAGFED